MTMHPARRLCSVAVTGAGSGLGREIALAFAARGCIVFGTAASATEVQEVGAASGRRVSLAVCDVANADAVKAWAGGVSDALDGAGLDVLVSYERVETPGPLEILSLSEVRRTFEVNVFGAMTAINAFLPALRKAGGRLVQFSTWTASIPLPFEGLTGASMAAMEALAAVYRAELKPFGVDVAVVPLGDLKTDGRAHVATACAELVSRMTVEQRDLYRSRVAVLADRTNRVSTEGMDPGDAAARVVEIAESQPAPSRVGLGLHADEMLRTAQERSDEELDALRLELVGLS